MNKIARHGLARQLIKIGFPGVSLTLIFIAAVFLYLIPRYEDSSMLSKRELVKNEVKTIIATMKYYHQSVEDGRMADAEAREQIKSLIRQIRFGESNSDYFWINDINGIMIAHPYRDDYENTSMIDYKDQAGKYFFREMIELCRKENSGYITYVWQKNSNVAVLDEKLSYVELFEPWQWIVGTGVYLDDVKDEIHRLEIRFMYMSIVSFLMLLSYIVYVSIKTFRLERMKLAAYSQIQEKEDYFRRIIYTLSEGLVVIDRSGKILFFNNFLEEHTGKTASDTSGSNIESILNLKKLGTSEPVDLPYSVLPPESIIHLNAEHEDKYGRRHVFKVILHCIAIAGSKEEFIVITIQENTKLYDTLALYKQQQQDLDRLVAERTQRLEKAIEDLSLANNAIDSAASAIVVTDDKGVAIMANKAAQMLSGVRVEEILGRPYPLFDPTQFQVLSSRQSMDVLQQGQIWRGEISRTHHNGSSIIEDVTITPLVDENGNVAHFISIEHDSSERRRETEFLQRLQAAFDQSLDGVFIINTDGVVEFVNNSCAAMHGRTKEYLIGKPLSIFFSDDVFNGEISPQIQNLFINGEASFEVRQRHSSGNEFPSMLSAKIITDSGGIPMSALFIVRDITEKQRLEMELRQAQKLESIGQLAAGIAHEINTPIQFIGDSLHYLDESSQELFSLISSYESVMESCVDRELTGRLAEIRDQNDIEFHREELPKAMERIRRGVERVTKIVRAMKEFAHPDSSEMEESDLNQLIETSTVVSTNEYKYVADMEFEPCDIPLVSCKPGEINQVLINIIVNAAHAIREKTSQSGGRGKIKIKTAVEEKHILIAISDTGNGIPEKIRSRIFDPFFTTKGVGLGSGQGLAISRSIIVDKHHGSLTFETETGIGTTFFIRLPLRTETEQPQ